MKYKLTISRHIEAQNEQSAINSLFLNGVADKTTIYTDLIEAEAAYQIAVNELQDPKELKHNLFWYSGAMLETYDDQNLFMDLIYVEVRG